jgi:hypothetical protein
MGCLGNAERRGRGAIWLKCIEAKQRKLYLHYGARLHERCIEYKQGLPGIIAAPRPRPARLLCRMVSERQGCEVYDKAGGLSIINLAYCLSCLKHNV